MEKSLGCGTLVKKLIFEHNVASYKPISCQKQIKANKKRPNKTFKGKLREIKSLVAVCRTCWIYVSLLI